jgi:toxin HigB-1
MIFNARLSDNAENDLLKVPKHIAEKLFYWIRIVRLEGLEKARLIKGYHDEPLKGKRKGQRSIRLSRSYRAIYSIHEEKVKIAFIEEVNKHEY